MDRETFDRLFPEGAPAEVVAQAHQTVPAKRRDCVFCGGRCLLEFWTGAWKSPEGFYARGLGHLVDGKGSE